MYVYVAGPYTHGDQVVNVRTAIEAATRILDSGHVPFVPHLNMLWHLHEPRPYEDWLGYDLAWLGRCDALVRLSGVSPGADREVRAAQALDLPVFHGIDAFLAGVTHLHD